MKYTVNPDYGYTVTLNSLNVHVTYYEVSRTKKFKFQPVADGQTAVGDDGTYPARLLIKGRVLKSDGVDPEVSLNDDLWNDMRYFLNLDRLFFNAARLESFRTFTNMNSQFIDCEITFLCDSYLEGAHNASNA